MDTPSPELRRTHLSRLTTPKSVTCRKILNSPVFFANRALTDFSELSMSPLQLLDSPAQAAIMTPSTSSGESSGRKSPRFLKQTSTPSDDIVHDTPTNKNKAFIIASNAFVGIKAKRRLIEDEPDHKDNTQYQSTSGKEESPVQENVAKKQKMSIKLVSCPKLSMSKKKFAGQINLGVSHRIRRSEKKVKASVLSISLSDLKKAKAEGTLKNPFDPLNKSLQSVKDLDSSGEKPQTDSEHVRAEPVPTNVKIVKPVDRISTPKVNPVPALVKQEKKTITMSPKVLTRNWNQRFRKDTRERKFFKSRGTEDDAPSRVVTVSVNQNLK